MKVSKSSVPVWRWLRRYWLLLAAGLLCALTGSLWIAGRLTAFPPAVPLAHIYPEDSLQAAGAVSKLEAYRLEIEEAQHQQYRQQQAMEKIIAMDFGQLLKEGEGEAAPEAASALSARQASVAHGRQTGGQAPRDPAFRPAQSGSQALKKTAKRSVQEEKAEKEAEAPVAASPFYTLRAEGAPLPPAEGRAVEGKRFYRALVHGDQLITPHASLCFRLQDSLFLGEVVIPPNTLLYGRWEGRHGGRQHISLYQVEGLPLTLRVYDLDYRQGLLSWQADPLPEGLAEGREVVVNQLMEAVPYGGWFSGLARAGKRLLRKEERKPLQLPDGQVVFLFPDVSFKIPSK